MHFNLFELLFELQFLSYHRHHKQIGLISFIYSTAEGVDVDVIWARLFSRILLKICRSKMIYFKPVSVDESKNLTLAKCNSTLCCLYCAKCYEPL